MKTITKYQITNNSLITLYKLIMINSSSIFNMVNYPKNIQNNNIDNNENSIEPANVESFMAEIKKESVSEYLENTTSSFLFRNNYTDEKVKIRLENQKFEDLFLAAKSEWGEEKWNAIKELLSNMPGDIYIEKTRNLFLLQKPQENESIQNKIDKIYPDINKDYEEMVTDNKDSIENTYKILEYLVPCPCPNGIGGIRRVTFFLNKIQEVWDKISNVVHHNQIGGGIMKAYDQDTKNQLSHFKSDKHRLLALQSIQKNRLLFSTYGSLVVMTGIYSMFYLYNTYLPDNNNIININTNITPSSNNSNILDKSILLFSFFNKFPHWVKLLLTFILISLFIIIAYTYIYPLLYKYIVFISEKFFFFKLILTLTIFITIIYYILILYLINKYSKLNKEPVLYKFIPSFIKYEILNLYEISQIEEEDRQIIIDNNKKTMLFMIILFLISAITLII